MRLALLPLLLAACTSCAGTQRTGLTAVEQHNQMVKITVDCGGHEYRGSGALISPGLVLTANHVVSCPLFPGFDLPIYLPPDKIVVSSTETAWSEATVERGSIALDLATVRLKSAKLDVWSEAQHVGRAPRIGDRVCEVSAHPRATYRCGEVQESEPGRIRVSFTVEPGNSGSAIYNAAGEIVGVITHRYLCSTSPCGGLGTALAPSGFLVPESN